MHIFDPKERSDIEALGLVKDGAEPGEGRSKRAIRQPEKLVTHTLNEEF